MIIGVHCQFFSGKRLIIRARALGRKEKTLKEEKTKQRLSGSDKRAE